MTAGPVRYARAGDAAIAYRVLGDAGPYLVDFRGVLPGLLAADHPLTRGYWERLSRFTRVVVMDFQGSGRSDPLPTGAAASVEGAAEQVLAVLADAGIESAYLCGSDVGGAFGVKVAVDRPDLVRGLVLINAYARLLADSEYEFGVDPSVMQRYLDARRDLHGTGFMLDLYAPSVAGDPEVRAFWSDCEQQASSRAQATALSRIGWTLDVRGLLPRVAVPTLVLHTSDNTMLSVEHGRYLAAHIPNARLVEIPGGDHLVLWETGPIVADEIETFITGIRPVARAERGLAAVLFTDLVGSTERAREVGDRRWRRVLDEYERLSSDAIDRFRGRLVKHTGDGALATFGSASDAIGCALDITRAVRHLGLETHSGIHVGDVERRGDDIGGSTVNVAARVAAAASGGEVLLTAAASEAAAGSGTRISAAGEHTLKGLPEPRLLYRVENDPDSRARDT